MSKRFCERFGGSDNKLSSGKNAGENAKSKEFQKSSQDMFQYYKTKASRLEKKFDSISDLLNNIKSTCDLSTELQAELNLRNEEVSRLQQLVSDLQINVFRLKEHCATLNAENDRLRIREFEDRKKINALLIMTGNTDVEMLRVFSESSRGIYVQKKLPPRLQKLKESKRGICKSASAMLKTDDDEGSETPDPQILILKNHALAAQLEHHLRISKDQIQGLHNDREIMIQERQSERNRLQKQIDLLSSKLKQTRDILHETSSKLKSNEEMFEKERHVWMEEKDKLTRTIKVLKDQNGEKNLDILGCTVNGVGCKRNCVETEYMREQVLEKEQLAASYQEQIIAMESEINRLKERAQTCRKNFKEKMDKMSDQTLYLKNKYEDLDRRRLLEAEGFRTDIKMLRDRLKDLEKKLTKANLSHNIQPSENQLLISARNTLNRAQQLEKELLNMKSKMSFIQENEKQ